MNASKTRFSLPSVRKKNTIPEAVPIQMVDTSGVRLRGWMWANRLGIAPRRAIDSDVRAVGRIVVCVEAEAEVSTQMISSLSSTPPSTLLPIGAKMSSGWSISVLGPPKACAATVTSR